MIVHNCHLEIMSFLERIKALNRPYEVDGLKALAGWLDQLPVDRLDFPSQKLKLPEHLLRDLKVTQRMNR